MGRFGKILAYLKNYRRNREVLRILDEKSTFPFLLEYYRICLRYSNNKAVSSEQILSRLIIEGHSIEKGLAMRKTRYGFGQKKILSIVELCNTYLDRFHDEPSRLVYVVGILREYDLLHKNIGNTLEEETQKKLDALFERCNQKIVVPETVMTTKEEYFAEVMSSFDRFSNSRHSVRDFTGESVPREMMEKVFKLAQQCPSACNRQSVRVYCVYDDKKRSRMVELQNHGRGFADKASPVLVIAFEEQDWRSGEEWFGGYMDSGIYIMNLLYALHYYGIAAIPLNWYADGSSNNELHHILDIPESQVPVAFVACGYPVDTFKLVTSRRNDIKEVISFIEE